MKLTKPLPTSYKIFNGSTLGGGEWAVLLRVAYPRLCGPRICGFPAACIDYVESVFGDRPSHGSAIFGIYMFEEVRSISIRGEFPGATSHGPIPDDRRFPCLPQDDRQHYAQPEHEEPQRGCRGACGALSA